MLTPFLVEFCIWCLLTGGGEKPTEASKKIDAQVYLHILDCKQIYRGNKGFSFAGRRYF